MDDCVSLAQPRVEISTCRVAAWRADYSTTGLGLIYQRGIIASVFIFKIFALFKKIFCLDKVNISGLRH